MLFFFFFKHKTAYEMRISDWSSDVCSSDLNLFIFSMGRLHLGAAPIAPKGGFVNPDLYADPLPQALVLTAIVISFATTALFLVVLIAARGFSGTDHVDGREDAPR